MLPSDCSCVNYLAIAATLTAILIAYFKWTYQYWQRRNFPFLKPRIPWGTSTSPFEIKEYVGIQLKRHYDAIKANGWKHGGLYFITVPSYLVTDLDYIKNILAKDFQYFVDRGFYCNEKADPLSGHLFALGGQKWRRLRTKLTPTFTSGKMRVMFQTLLNCLPNLVEKIDSDCVNQAPIDVKETLGCFTTDVIGSCAFGLDCNTFKDEDSPFRRYGRKAIASTPSQMLRMLFTMIFPTVSNIIGLTITPKDASAFYLKVVKDTVEYREANKVTRNDLLQTLIDLKNQPSDGLTIEEIAAQCFGFFFAGFETSSTTVAFALYELARNPDLQDKARRELNTVLEKHEGAITYESIQEMKYMDQVVNETLRKYPPVPFISRKCVKDYKVPDEDVVIENGIFVVVPIFAIHYDEEFYPDPQKFDPERFSEENKKSRHQYAHIPFGEGPRICIGIRFGLMQTKVGLAALLKRYRFTVDKRTQEPLKISPTSAILAAEGGIWLRAEKL